MAVYRRLYRWYRGEMIETLEKGGYIWCNESCWKQAAPIYKTIEDTKNAIRKHMDGRHKAEPRVIGEYIWSADTRDWTAVYN